MTPAEHYLKYEKETGRKVITFRETFYFQDYVQWLESGKEKAEQERDEAIKQAVELFKIIKTYLSYSSIDGKPERIELRNDMRRLSEQFLDKYKESAK